MRKILLSVCCAPDSTHSINALREAGFEPVLFLYNPNIHPYNEYLKRIFEMKKTAAAFGAEAVCPDDWGAKEWFGFVEEFKHEKEGGKRCSACFALRMEKSALAAKKLGIGLFTTTLTISPHKDAKLINSLGAEAAAGHGVEYLATDFKKKDGFKKSVALSKAHGIYRQNYCGCSYSLLERRAGKPIKI
ncbi:MAG TPA: epoxyqueuosine reductase QueH [bacterium]|nr:epoxyqueuosine reductase QueH [bacterium]